MQGPDRNNYPRQPGRQWMLWALECLGDTDGGSNQDLADRLALFGFDVEAPPVTEPADPSRPYPSKPTDGWVLSTLRELGHNPRDMKDAERVRALHAAGFTRVEA